MSDAIVEADGMDGEDKDFSDERKFRLLTHIDSLLQTVKSILTFVRWGIVVLAVLVLGSFLRSFVVQNQVDDVGDAAKNALLASESARDTSLEGRDAAVDVQRTLNEILQQLEENADNPQLNNQAIIDALQAIARIEGQICDGRCPDPE